MASKTMALRRESRGGTKVIWLCLHTSEGGGTARQLRDADWWEGSSHAISDTTELLTAAQGCVDPAFAAWTLRNGNHRSENIEQIGQAKWTREHWLTERMPQLRLTAQWLANRSKARGIPLTYVGVAGVKARTAGVIQHNDYSVGTGDGDHWDCGPNYPIDVVIDLARDLATGHKPASVSKPRPPAPRPAAPPVAARAAAPPAAPPHPTKEKDMFSEDDRKLLREVKARLDDDGAIGKRTKDSRDRIFGMLQQRWYTTDPSGRAVRCAAGDPGAKPCSALDTLDGAFLVTRIAGAVTELKGLLERADAATPAAAEPVAAAPTSPTQIAADVPDGMVAEVIEALTARLGVPVGAGVG